jgi:Protein of unknown function DUF262
VQDEDQDLGEADQEEHFDFPPADRRVVTQAYDLSITTLIEQWADQILVVPDFQRGYVWDNGKASRLIESLLIGIPIPVLYFYETPAAKYEIIDGHQRVRSIVRFTNNEFQLTSMRVLDDLNGKRSHQLPEREQRLLRTRVIRAIIVSYESSAQMKFEIFGRLNTGAMQINAQEIRNALFAGSLNQLLAELELQPQFRQAIGTRNPRPRMVDRELALRFLGLHAGITKYRPPLIKFLNDYAKENRLAPKAKITQLRSAFTLASTRVSQLFGSAAFRPMAKDGTPLDRNVNRALFDAQMLNCSWIPTNVDVEPFREPVLASTASLYSDDGFMDSIQRATGDRARLRKRVLMYADAMKAAGLKPRVPKLPD